VQTVKDMFTQIKICLNWIPLYELNLSSGGCLKPGYKQEFEPAAIYNTL
jgi:hypothetical protein